MVLSGKLKAIIGDDGTNFQKKVLESGDTIVLAGTMHTWFNDGPDDCYMMAAKFGI